MGYHAAVYRAGLSCAVVYCATLCCLVVLRCAVWCYGALRMLLYFATGSAAIGYAVVPCCDVMHHAVLYSVVLS